MTRNGMRSGGAAIFACAAVLLFTGPARGQEVNAADLYREALNQVPTSDQAVRTIKNSDESPLADARRTVAEGKVALDLVSRATTATKVDWGLDFGGKVGPDLSFLNDLRGLSGLAALQARVRLAEGKVREAAEGLWGAMVMGRRIQRMPTLITRMLGATVEISAFHQLAAAMPALDEGSAKSLAERFDSLPPPPALREVQAVEDRLAGEAAPAEALEKQAAFDGWAAANRAMFRAALAHRTGGDAALAKVKDPFGDVPFAIRKYDGGYELTSKLVYRGKPVTLSVGKMEGGR